jgi:hypothetical protein
MLPPCCTSHDCRLPMLWQRDGMQMSVVASMAAEAQSELTKAQYLNLS